ncbi:MAG: glycosyltransferase [Deltaproteobacteria bacterium]
MLKVMFVLPNLGSGGAERNTLNLMRNLDRSRFKPVLFLVKNEGVLSKEVPADVEVFKALESGQRMRWHLPRIVQKLCQAAADADVIIGAVEFETIYFAAIAGWLLKRPVMGWIRDDMALFRHNAVTYLVNRRALSSLKQIITVSCGVAASVSHLFPGLQGKIKTIYNFVDPEYIGQLANAAPELAKDIPIVIGAGRLEPRKNFQLLIRAHADLLARGISNKLIIIGEGPERANLEQMVRNLGVEATVDLPGFQSNPYSWIRQARVFVMCSNIEGFSGVIIEAMALGVPVVATDCPSGPAEILENGRYGFLIPLDDKAALVEAMTSLLGDASRVKYFSDLGLERVNDFRPELIIPQFEQAIEKVSQ